MAPLGPPPVIVVPAAVVMVVAPSRATVLIPAPFTEDTEAPATTLTEPV